MQIMTLKQWHSNDRQSKINTRTWVKNKKNWQSGKHTTTRLTTYYYIYLNQKRLRIIKDFQLKLLQTGSWKLCSLEPVRITSDCGSSQCSAGPLSCSASLVLPSPARDLCFLLSPSPQVISWIKAWPTNITNCWNLVFGLPAIFVSICVIRPTTK